PPPPPSLYALSLHDALLISLNQHQRAQTRAVDLPRSRQVDDQPPGPLVQLLQQLARGTAERRARIETQLLRGGQDSFAWARRHRDRKSTRLNSSHGSISYAV